MSDRRGHGTYRVSPTPFSCPQKRMFPIILGIMPPHGTTHVSAGKGPLKEVWYITIAPWGPSSPQVVSERPPGGGQLKNISYKYVVDLYFGFPQVRDFIPSRDRSVLQRDVANYTCFKLSKVYCAWGSDAQY